MVAPSSYCGSVWRRSQEFHNLFELKPTGFRAVSLLFHELSLVHGSIKAVLADPTLGQIWVDDLTSPRQAVLHGPEGTYLAGIPASASSDLAEAVADWNYVYPDVSWLPSIQHVLPNRFIVPHERMRLALNEPPPSPGALPRGLKFVAGEQPLGTSVALADKIVSRCTVDVVVDGYVELGVWTHPTHRGHGLAKLAASTTVDRAFKAGFESVGWHCHASNGRSINVATSMGFVVTNRYLAFSASLPAENDGDLSTAKCRDLAAHFGAGASEIPWLEFHAAAAWTLAGELDQALNAVERLVAQGWNGKAEWLEEHWAFEKLNGHPRFRAAVGRQRNVG